jgi:hypothetical protein
MSKTIVLCADGTWNGPDEQPSNSDGNTSEGTEGCEPQLTNVCKFFAWLDGDLQPAGSDWGGVEMEKALQNASGTLTQIAKYIHGVGNSRGLLDKVAGGAFGVGVVARIARGYTYMTILGERRMFGHDVVQTKAAEPTICQVQMYLFAKPTLRTNAEAVAHDQHANHELRIN